MSLLWINGQLVDKADARVSPFDHGFLYGDGVWQHLRVFRGRLFNPDDHFHRLYSDAAELGITVPLKPDELTAAVEATVRANERTEGYVRVIVSRGPGTVGPDPRKIDPLVIIIAEEYYPFPTELYDHGLHVAVAPVRLDASQPTFRARVLGRPEVVLAKAHALRHGCLDAVLVTTEGKLAGTTEGNLFLVRCGAVRAVMASPIDSAWNPVIDCVRPSGVPWSPFPDATPDDLLTAEETFIGGITCGVVAVVRVDGKDIGGGTEGPVTRGVRDRYRVLTRGRE
jgi:branched-chain amino acid aminotransferase